MNRWISLGILCVFSVPATGGDLLDIKRFRQFRSNVVDRLD